MAKNSWRHAGSVRTWQVEVRARKPRSCQQRYRWHLAKNATQMPAIGVAAYEHGGAVLPVGDLRRVAQKARGPHGGVEQRQHEQRQPHAQRRARGVVPEQHAEGAPTAVTDAAAGLRGHVVE